MNLGLVTSYIIGGIILLSILMMNMSLSSSATEITLTQVTREKMASISEMIAHDIQKIGYNRTDTTNTMLRKALGHIIIFDSNIDDSASVETITWEFIPDPDLSNPTTISCTDTPRKCVLMRTVENGTESNKTPIRAGVTEFNIKYYADYGEPISNAMNDPNGKIHSINQLYIKLAVESSEKIYNNAGGEGRYVKSVWEKRFSPPNLNLGEDS